jgi:DNA repair photolyase
VKEFRKNITGRGASSQLKNRFEKSHTELEAQDWDNYTEDEKPLLRTQFLTDSSKSILTENKSPDIGFRFSINAYRGCEHGCAYCYARPTHEYLGFSPGLDFESKIMVKENAPELLYEKLMSKSYQPEPIFLSGVTDCYQPIERKLKLTRRILEVLLQFKNPVGIITKNQLVARDADLLAEFAQFHGSLVFLSITTLDSDLCGKLEPRTSRPQARLQAIETLAKAGVRVGVNVAPVIPGLTDHEMPNILKAAKEAGASFAGYTPIRLPLAVSPIFTEWLEVHRPEKKEKVLSMIRDLRGGKLNDAEFGSRMRGEGPFAQNLQQMFKIYTQKYGLNEKDFDLSTEHFQRPGDQMSLF